MDLWVQRGSCGKRAERIQAEVTGTAVEEEAIARGGCKRRESSVVRTTVHGSASGVRGCQPEVGKGRL